MSDETTETLTKDELVLLQQILFKSSFTGEAWAGTIQPLINKLAKMTDANIRVDEGSPEV